MAEIITMPKLGFDMQEGILVRWIKNEGEEVAKGDVLAEIETDKATVEVESTHSGVLYKQLVETDTSVPIGDPIAIIADQDEEVDVEALVGKQDESKPPKEEGKPEKKESKVKEPEVKKQDIEAKDEDDDSESDLDGDRIKASPLARRMAEDNDLDLEKIDGTGPGGRIVKKDIELAIENKSRATETTKAAPVEEEKVVKKQEDGKSLPSMLWNKDEISREDKQVPLNKLRQAISRRMVDSKQNIPHFYVTRSINADRLMDLYKQVNETLPSNQKISINDFVIKATAIALSEFPNLNASVEGNNLIHHGNINIGVAVAVEGGLLTIVVRDADIKPIRIISQEVKEMAVRVRSGKVRSEDIEGSTFSISNLGMFDVENFAAIINPPESGILAVSSAKKEAVVENDEIKIAWQMKLTLSADHRATDGVEAAEFMKSIVFQLENPLRLML